MHQSLENQSRTQVQVTSSPVVILLKQPTLSSYSPLLTMGSQLLELDHLLQLPLEEFIEGIKGMQDDQNHSKDHQSNLPYQSRPNKVQGGLLS
ncbi:unnamed protein product [Musa acuminata subsp. malaccensis]|uniref:(wild Malaysian banana) hypothetical protein n=1 Tax=Musa acuminata subsp. malaccensis TaxID=214687 RepID=A0A804K2Q7_MUSAM|nr:unnamed protein product [Musa acuminata subsp. malaccensis]